MTSSDIPPFPEENPAPPEDDQRNSTSRQPPPKLISPTFNRQPGESSKAFQALECYLQAGPDRSILAVAKQLSKSRTIVGRWSRDWQWGKRALDFDNDQAEKQRRAYEERARLSWEKRTQREEDANEQDYQLSQELFAKARKMLEFPLATVRRDKAPDGSGDIVIVQPARWTMNSASALVKTGLELRRQALEVLPQDMEREEIWDIQDYKDPSD